jgi:hypothetical protein
MSLHSFRHHLDGLLLFENASGVIIGQFVLASLRSNPSGLNLDPILVATGGTEFAHYLFKKVVLNFRLYF